MKQNISKEKIQRLRQALIRDIGFDDGWSDEEIVTMAYRTIDFMRLIKCIRADQEGRTAL